MKTSIEQMSRAAMRVSMWMCVAVLAIGLTACEEDVVAVTGTDNPYSVYGVISPQLDSQWIRVFPIEGRLVPARPEPLDAQVVSTNVTTGEEHVWRDSIIVDFADQYAHAFWAPFRAEYEHSYRLRVERSDGAESYVEVTVPMRAELELGPAEIRSNAVIQPVFVNRPVPGLIEVEVEYAISYRPSGQTEIISDRVSVPYVLAHRQTEQGWVVPVNLHDDFDEVAAYLFDELEIGIDQRVGIILQNATIRLIVASEEWIPPGGVFNPELLIQPGVLDNVQNGFGFVGAGYRLEQEWTPSPDAIVAAGFRAPDES